MAKNYQTPGVYIEEISKLPSAIAPVETAIPAFMGRTEFARDEIGSNVLPSADKLPTPIRITSFLDYQQHFGGANAETAIFEATGMPTITDLKVGDVVQSRSITCNVKKESVSGKYLFYAIQLHFGNGGAPCYIVSSGDYDSNFDNTAGSACLDAIAKVDEPTILVFTDKHNSITNSTSGYSTLYDAALAQCRKLQDRITIFDPWVVTGNPFDDAATVRKDMGMSDLKYGCVYYPWLQTTLNYGYSEDSIKIKHVVNGGLGTYDGKTLSAIRAIDLNTYRLLKAEVEKNVIDLPPSSAVTGIMARVDNNRGVWKAPANESVKMVLGPTIKVTATQQEGLNVDASTGKSINVIRFFTGKGTIVWGARTLAGNDNEWRYISVRRFYNFVEESVKKATEFVVFEPNDANTWLRVKAMCENFLNQLWRQGALQGAKPDDAFFVRIGLGTTMTSLDVLEGRMNVEIGMAVVRPAEFIILKFSHKLQE
ncbi:phage tail sheath family protein [Pedobacter sandarakinus]|uniref:phage tail sheath family protein n=1 Tax=Pedobacter sandarakinus TaxID=353156 RepID=UPI0022464C84|nr:phage tail sheath C-terminal domain-containing protein [Pedobacter sandarakinus]MCX2574545.1 phage tail sheath subtilisin-like domain-containing protein [Pedobacter sandarakinus]